MYLEGVANVSRSLRETDEREQLKYFAQFGCAKRANGAFICCWRERLEPFKALLKDASESA
jgi:hypothetical protein